MPPPPIYVRTPSPARRVAGGRLTLLLALLAVVPAGAPAAAQEAALDTSRTYALDAVVVTADRAARVLGSATAAVSVVRGERMRALPTRTLAGALQRTPGLTFVHLDGLGYDPQPIQRGFYGGGEAEYLVVLRDGRPLNDLERGLVDWSLVPLLDLEAAESLRGGASALYGDAAIGGVVNLVPRRTAGTRAAVETGSYGTVEGQLSHRGTWRGRAVHLAASGLRTDGYRAHAARRGGTLGGGVDLAPGLTLTTLHAARVFDVPGPLPLAAADRRAASLLYRFDAVEERRHRLGLEARRTRAAGTLRAGLTGEVRAVDDVRTLELAPGFADTQARRLTARRLHANVVYDVHAAARPWSPRLVAGVDGAAGWLGSTYRAVATGVDAQYAAASGDPGAVLARGDARRMQGAAFVQAEARPLPRVRLTLGLRGDVLGDAFTPGAPGGDADASATHTALSPRAGVNVRYAATGRHVGHVFAAAGRSFKAATLDQLYGQRLIPLGEAAISLASPDLRPQRGTTVEAGVYHRVDGGHGVGAEATATVYHLRMRDELDFDLATFRYVNLGRSLHRGLETSLALFVPGVALSGGYTRQATTLAYGPNDGNQVKAVPRDVWTGALTAARGRLTAGASAHAAGGTWLDDANMERLPDWWTLDARLAVRLGGATAGVEVYNLLDRRYSTTGHLLADLATGAETAYVYPAAGRTLRLSLRAAF